MIRCLPDGGRIETMYKTKDTIGIGVWDGEMCIAQFHCYRPDLPDGTAIHWPDWAMGNSQPKVMAAVEAALMQDVQNRISTLN